MNFLKQAQQAANQFGVNMPSGGNDSSNDNNNDNNKTSLETNSTDAGNKAPSSTDDSNKWQDVGSDGRAAYDDYTSGAHKGNLMGAFGGVAKEAGAALQAGGGKVADPQGTLRDLYTGATGGAKKAGGAIASAASAVGNSVGNSVGDAAGDDGKEAVQQGVDGTRRAVDGATNAVADTTTAAYQQVQDGVQEGAQELDV